MKKYKLSDILVPLISCVLIFGLLIYSLLTVSNIFNLYNKIDIYTSNIAVYQDNIARLSTLSEDSIKNKLNTFDSSIPTGGDVANLVNNTIKLAQSFGLDAQKDTSQADKNKDKTKTTPKQAVDVEDLRSGDLDVIPEGLLINGFVYPINLSMSLKGTKENILLFIESISKQTRILSVNNLILKRLTDSGNVSLWQGNVNIISYAVTEPKSDQRRLQPITDPEDLKLINIVKKINTTIE